MSCQWEIGAKLLPGMQCEVLGKAEFTLSGPCIVYYTEAVLQQVTLNITSHVLRVRMENSRNSWLSKLQKFFFEKFFFRDLKVTFRCGFISSTYLTSSHSDPLVAHQKPRGQSGCCSARGQGAACNRAGALGASCCLPAHLTHQWDLNIEGFCLIRVEKDNHPASCKEWRGVTNQKVGRRTKQTLLQGRHSDG